MLKGFKTIFKNFLCECFNSHPRRWCVESLQIMFDSEGSLQVSTAIPGGGVLKDSEAITALVKLMFQQPSQEVVC